MHSTIYRHIYTISEDNQWQVLYYTCPVSFFWGYLIKGKYIGPQASNNSNEAISTTFYSYDNRHMKCFIA